MSEKHPPRVVLLGPAGIGKGYLAQTLGQELQVRALIMSEALRQMEFREDEGMLMKAAIKSGELVRDDLVVRALSKSLPREEGWVITGAPKTRDQLRWMMDPQRFGGQRILFLFLDGLNEGIRWHRFCRNRENKTPIRNMHDLFVRRDHYYWRSSGNLKKLIGGNPDWEAMTLQIHSQMDTDDIIQAIADSLEDDMSMATAS